MFVHLVKRRYLYPLQFNEQPPIYFDSHEAAFTAMLEYAKVRSLVTLQYFVDSSFLHWWEAEWKALAALVKEAERIL